MLLTIMKHLRNYFLTNVKEERSFTIQSGMISLSFVNSGQYVLIDGSNFNDGVYTYPMTNLTDETFYGSITVLNPPKEFLDLATEIQSYVTKHKGSEGYASESFGGYSYQKATNSAGLTAGWSDVYKDRLDVWRKI